LTLPLGFHDLHEALHERGCPVCRVMLRGVTSFLDGLLYEYVNTPPVHRDFRAGRGLCNRHMWQLPTFRGVSLGVAILDAAVLDELLTTLDKHEPDAVSGGFGRLWRNRRDYTTLADALEPTGPCIACREAERIEARSLHTFAHHFDLFAEALEASDGLCLPHIRLLLRGPVPAATGTAFLAAQRRIWQRIKAELEMFQRKSDINHADEPIGAEGDSWIRAIDALAGTRDALPDRDRT
jgi:hypothetical protein